MFNFLEIIDRPGFATLISIVLGFGLACIFRPLCKVPDCLIIRGPPIDEIRGAVFQFGTKCVEFDAKAIECPPKDGKVTVVDTMSFAALG